MDYKKRLIFLILILTCSHFYNADDLLFLESQYITSETTILNLPLTTPTTFSELSKHFHYQYSYDKHSGYSDSNPNEQYYSLHSIGLRISIYAGDKSHTKTSPTDPRSEISVLDILKDNIDYSISFDQLISEYPSGYQFCWMQVFAANGPNIMLRYRGGRYQLLSFAGKLTLLGELSEDIGKWTNWRLNFKLATSGGYIKVYRDGKLIGSIEGNTSGGDHSHLKHGIYSQKMNPPGTMTTYTKNMIITETK